MRPKCPVVDPEAVSRLTRRVVTDTRIGGAEGVGRHVRFVVQPPHGCGCMAGLLSLPPTIGKPLPTAPDRHAHSHRHKLKQVNRSGWIAATAALVLTLGVVGVGVANAGL